MVQHGRSWPPSVQIANALRDRIARGEFAPGDLLPTILALAAEYGVTTNTVQKGLKILKREGLVESIPGYGTLVKPE